MICEGMGSIKKKSGTNGILRRSNYYLSLSEDNLCFLWKFIKSKQELAAKIFIA